jgi:hypothetical protein
MATKRAPQKSAKTKKTTKPRLSAALKKQQTVKSQLRAVKPGSLILVHFVERQLEGWMFTREHWPLHISLVSWFEADDEEAIFRSLERLAGDTAPMILQVGGQEKFGVKKDVPVNIIKNQAPIHKLHENILSTLEGADITLHENSFSRGKYRAHITRYTRDGRHSNDGERVIVNDFHLVRLLKDNTCIVEQAFDLLG